MANLHNEYIFSSLEGASPSAEELYSIEKEHETSDDFKFPAKIYESAFSSYLDDIKYQPRLTDEQVLKLAIAKDAGSIDARNQLVEGNLRLVIANAISFAKRFSLDPSDLTQDGNIGLIKAVERYDHTTGCRFSTYATWWIRQAISRGIEEHGRSIRIPSHSHSKLAKVLKTEARFYMEHGREPTTEEVASILGIKAEDIVTLKISSTPISLSTPLNEGEDADELGDFIMDDNANVYEAFEKKHLRETLIPKIEEALDYNEKMIAVVKMRFGFYNGNEMTLQEIGKELHLSRERIRQIEKRALRRLKYNKEVTALFRDFKQG